VDEVLDGVEVVVHEHLPGGLKLVFVGVVVVLWLELLHVEVEDVLADQLGGDAVLAEFWHASRCLEEPQVFVFIVKPVSYPLARLAIQQGDDLELVPFLLLFYKCVLRSSRRRRRSLLLTQRAG
jgi:hypothetical protein